MHQPTISRITVDTAYEYMIAPPAPIATSAGPVAITALGAIPATDWASTSKPLMDDPARPVSVALTDFRVVVVMRAPHRDGSGPRRRCGRPGFRRAGRESGYRRRIRTASGGS